MIEYKGYIGAVDFDSEIDLFHGTVININDVITFYGASVSELREEMQKSIEDYFEFCKEQGKIPEKPFSGEFTVQMSPEVHCKLALNAERLHLDFNAYLQEVLEKIVLIDNSPLNLANYRTHRADGRIDNKLVKQQTTVAVGWTNERVRNLVPPEFRKHYESKYTDERCRIIYKWVADSLNFVKEKGWKLHPKFSKGYCSLWSESRKGHKGCRVFSLRIDFNPPRFCTTITEEEVERLRNRYGCQIVYYHTKSQIASYVVHSEIEELLPVLEFAYKKHSGN